MKKIIICFNHNIKIRSRRAKSNKVVVGKQGKYIESENQYESSSYECAFKMKVNE